MSAKNAPPRPAATSERTSASRAAGAPRRAGPRAALPRERLWVACLLAIHVALATWGLLRNSVTFDENYHVPAGVMIVARGEVRISSVNPPLVKALCGAAALAAGARLPSAEALRDGEQGVVGESFMRENADRYHRVYVAARLAVLALSVALGLLIWRASRRLFGARAGVLSLAFYAFAPEALAHAGFATMDLATGLTWLASLYAFWMFARSGRWGWWCAASLGVSTAFLVRFSALLLPGVLAAVALLVVTQRRARHPIRLWLGLGLFVPVVLVALHAGFLGHTSFDPLSRWTFGSSALQALQRAAPALRLPLPDAYLGGLDRQAMDTETGATLTYLLGRIIEHRVWYYFPLAMLFKWPLGFLGAIAIRAFRPLGRRDVRAAFLPLAIALFLGAAMFSVSINAGVRYVFPILPLLCVWLGGLVAVATRKSERASGTWRRAAVALAMLQALECGLTAPWYLSFFNWPSGGPGRGDRLLNDSNEDWGQGLIALKEELARRHIARVHLAYHGTTDPAMYGIESVPYVGGMPGAESDWLAVSSFYFVGLSQKMMTAHGRTPRLKLDFESLWRVPPAARPADCMYLFRLR